MKKDTILAFALGAIAIAVLCVAILMLPQENRPRSDSTSGPEASVAGTGGQCSLHGVELESDTVQIVYGNLAVRPGYDQAEESTFPYASAFIKGPCVLPVDSPETGRVEYCPRCRHARNKWIAKHE